MGGSRSSTTLVPSTRTLASWFVVALCGFLVGVEGWEYTGECLGGGLALTVELYEQGYEAYKDAVCIPECAFSTVSNLCPGSPGVKFKGNVVLTNMDKLEDVGALAFFDFAGSIIITGSFPRWTSIGNMAFKSAGTKSGTCVAKDPFHVDADVHIPLCAEQTRATDSNEAPDFEEATDVLFYECAPELEACEMDASCEALLETLVAEERLGTTAEVAAAGFQAGMLFQCYICATASNDDTLVCDWVPQDSKIELQCRGDTWTLGDGAFDVFNGAHNDEGEGCACSDPAVGTDQTCSNACSDAGIEQADGSCVCNDPAVGVGPACEFSNAKTCSDAGVVQVNYQVFTVNSECEEKGKMTCCNRNCVRAEHRNDGDNDCGDGSDESNPPFSACRIGDISHDSSCVCNGPATGVGPSCEFSNAKTCSGVGVAQANGSCVCDDPAIGVGPSCEFSNAKTCSDAGVAQADGTCACTDPAVGTGQTCSEHTNAQTCSDAGVAQADGSCVCTDSTVGVGPACEFSNAKTCSDAGVVNHKYLHKVFTVKSECEERGWSTQNGTPIDFVSCCDGRCISAEYLNDGVNDCQDGSDESNPPFSACSSICTCDPNTAGPACEFSNSKTCNNAGVVDALGQCTCNDRAVIAGLSCEYTNAKTCSGAGEVDADGQCTCTTNDPAVGGIGPSCMFTNAKTCSDAGVVNTTVSTVYTYVNSKCEERGEVTCCNGKCIGGWLIHDGDNDCGDWSDETNPPFSACSSICTCDPNTAGPACEFSNSKTCNNAGVVDDLGQCTCNDRAVIAFTHNDLKNITKQLKKVAAASGGATDNDGSGDNDSWTTQAPDDDVQAPHLNCCNGTFAACGLREICAGTDEESNSGGAGLHSCEYTNTKTCSDAGIAQADGSCVCNDPAVGVGPACEFSNAKTCSDAGVVQVNYQVFTVKSECEERGRLTCCNGKCISKRFRNDGDNDCGDGSDEQNPPLSTCSSFSQHPIIEGNGTFSSRLMTSCVCNGPATGLGPTCSEISNAKTCSDAGVAQVDGTCVCNDPAIGVGPSCEYSNAKTCSDAGVVQVGYHGQVSTVKSECEERDEVTCCNGKCISAAYQNDGNNDCGDESDEQNPPFSTCRIGDILGLVMPWMKVYESSCMCTDPAVGVGPSCEYSNAKTCSGAGIAQVDGSCVCNGPATGLGPTCSEVSNAKTCSDAGVVQVNYDLTDYSLGALGAWYYSSCVCNGPATGLGPTCSEFSNAKTCSDAGVVQVNLTLFPDSSVGCVCTDPAVGVGPSCEFSNSKTCSDAGVVDALGQCTCNDRAAISGVSCKYTNAITCSDAGVAQADGSCVCNDGWGGAFCAEESASLNVRSIIGSVTGGITFLIGVIVLVVRVRKADNKCAEIFIVCRCTDRETEDPDDIIVQNSTVTFFEAHGNKTETAIQFPLQKS